GPAAEPRVAENWAAGADLRGATVSPAGKLTNGTFAEPSPIELPAGPLVERPAAPSSGRRKEYEPLVPIVLDESDEIIQLDSPPGSIRRRARGPRRRVERADPIPPFGPRQVERLARQPRQPVGTFERVPRRHHRDAYAGGEAHVPGGEAGRLRPQRL